MKKPLFLSPHPVRMSKHYKRYDIEVPKELLDMKPSKPDLSCLKYPLPLRKADYTCSSFCENGVRWLGGNGGVTRFDPNAKLESDVIMFFSADRDLLDNNVRAVIAEENSAWVLTDSGVTHIELVTISCEEKAKLLLNETLSCVARHDMVSQRMLSEPRNVKSGVPFGHSDNDGCFSAGFAIGEIFRYATLKKEKGGDHPETVKAREIAMTASEACLLLMYVSGRGDGFVARTYVAGNEPVPDDGLFYKKNGETAVCINTTFARKKGLVGKEVKADAPIPDRLARHYRDEGHKDTDITYKGDTSSDEITLHYLHILVAHEFLGSEDAEYDSLLTAAAESTLGHIIGHGYELYECDGKPTTWAKWSESYFNTGMGWADACLNAAELLMYLRVTMHVSGRTEPWQVEYDKLVEAGYAELTLKHLDRYNQMCVLGGLDLREDLMYGDHMLAVASFWGLITLEPDNGLREKYKAAFRTWRSTLDAEHNPGYDFPYMLVCPEDEELFDSEPYAVWFYRFNASRLAAGVSLDKRYDIPVKINRGGYTETSCLLPPDERFISKYDRNPLKYANEDSGGIHCVESCYPYTFAYWIGRFFGFIKEER